MEQDNLDRRILPLYHRPAPSSNPSEPPTSSTTKASPTSYPKRHPPAPDVATERARSPPSSSAADDGSAGKDGSFAADDESDDEDRAGETVMAAQIGTGGERMTGKEAKLG